MKTIFLAVFTFMSTLTYAEDLPSAKICKVLKDSLSAKHSPEQLCKKYDGHFCSDMKNHAQAVCASMGKSFCNDIKSEGEALCKAGDGRGCDSRMKTLASGYCAILKGNFCDSETDEGKWKKKLAEQCYWDDKD